MIQYYFLDRCVLIVIRDYISNAQKSTNRIINERISNLIKLDRDDAIVSIMPALMEGNIKFKNNKELWRQNIESELVNIQKFFKQAELHPSPENWENIQKLYNAEHENSFDNCCRFLKQISMFLYQPVSSRKYREYEERILSIAEDNNILSSVHVILCALAVLYKNIDACNVLKLKQNYSDDEIYNSANDIFIISRTISMSSMVYIEYRNVNIEFITYDIALQSLYKYLIPINMRVTQSTNGNIAVCGLSIEQKLFPALSSPEINQLIDRLKLRISH